MKSRLFATLLVAAALGLAVALPALAASGFRAHGFVLPDGAVKVDANRFRLPQAWDDALRFYRFYPWNRYPRTVLHSESYVRAVHIDNPRASGDEWQGVNLYELPRGEVRVYILVPPGTPDEDAGGGPAK